MGMGGQRHAPAPLPLGKTLFPLYRRLDGPQDPSGQVQKISPPSVFDPRAVQPVASRYTDWAIPAHGGAIETLTFKSWNKAWLWSLEKCEALGEAIFGKYQPTGHNKE